MPQFKKKPVEVEAVQFDGSHESQLAAIQFAPGSVAAVADGVPVVMVHIAGQGFSTCRPGDWVIKGVAGEFYPCSMEVFAATYEEVGP